MIGCFNRPAGTNTAGLAWYRSAAACAVVMLTATRPCAVYSDDQAPHGTIKRVPWTTSNVVGSPEPPLPFVAERIMERIAWDRPIYAKREPATANLVVIQQGGEQDRPSQVLRVADQLDADQTTPLLEVPQRLIYGLEFHPQYPSNRFLFVFSNGPGGQADRQNRISRYTVDPQSQTCQPDSEQIIIEWASAGHDGGDLVFGHDGMLYITSGDGTSDSDTLLSGQNVGDLLGGVIRIDVDRPAASAPYSIPADNPFLAIDGARPEWWAIGLRNPWRLSIDSRTGQIWVGNNGQDLWETVHLLGRGENYGWSVYEGSHPFYPNRELGPGKLTKPTFEHHHRESRSLTGGVVYDGDQWTELQGAYVYGDYATGKIWAGRHDGDRVVWHREIADTDLQIAGFSNTHRGDLLVIDHAGGLYRITANPSLSQPSLPAFPRKLSETGLFESVPEHRVAPGVIPYWINSPAWNDGAVVARYLAVPRDQQVGFAESRGWDFDDGAVLMQTLAIGELADHAQRRIETRILTKQNNEWAGYSYRWNDQQTDGELIPADGAESEIPVAAANGAGHAWRFPSRAECMSCHSRAAGFVLGVTGAQLNRTQPDQPALGNQLQTLNQFELFRSPINKSPNELPKLADPYDQHAELTSRARAYLHTNCAGCHVQAGGGNARIVLDHATPLEQMMVVSQFPQHSTFGISGARIIAPGDADRSILYQRVTRRGPGQMPPLGSNRVDQHGADLIKAWIESMKPNLVQFRQWTLAELVPHLEQMKQDRAPDKGKQLFLTSGCAQCHRINDLGGGVGPNLSGIGRRLQPQEILTAIVTPSASVLPPYQSTRFVTTDGRLVTGRIETEDDTAVVIRDSEGRRTLIAIDEIESRAVARVSSMPTGTIDHLQLPQILDLLAYLTSHDLPQ